MSDHDIQQWAADRAGSTPTAAEAQALVRRARHGDSPKPLWRWVPPMVMAGAAVAALLVIGARQLTPAPVEAVIAIDAPVAPIEQPEEEIAWLPEGEQSLGETHLIVASGAKVTHDTQSGALRLTAGDIDVWSMDPFEVSTESWTVAAKTARVAVSQSPFAVHVTEGTVSIVGAGERVWELIAGDRFEGGERIRPEPPAPPPAPALPALSELRSLVVSGDLEAARAGLTTLSDAGDLEATALLAKVAEKLGDTGGALAAWARIIATGGAGAQEARYRSAMLLEAQPAEAIPLLQAFLTTPDPLAADARLRLGKALLATGQTEAGNAELERVIADHPGTTPARVAQGLLP